MIKDNRDGGGSVGAFVGCLFFLEIVGARGQLAFQGLFQALIFGGGFAFLGNEIGGGEKALVWLSPVSKAEVG